IADFDNQIQANQMAGQVVNMGGAGVVYNRGEYFVFTSSYPTLDCAQEVSQNLKDLGYKSKIITLNIDSISFEYKGKNSDAILECFQIFKKCYLDLYDLSVAFDKLQCDYTEVNSKILLKQKVISQIGLKLSNTAQELKIKDICQTRLTNLSNLLNIAIKTANSNNNYTSNLKQVLIKLAILNQEFVKQVNSVK
ncbi:MAG: hypothetical protein IJD48_03140, partial [Clostridia bacterium]|nr:hypothetical protein [Clostridia bacterium]